MTCLIVGVGLWMLFSSVQYQATAKIKIISLDFDQSIRGEYLQRHQCGWYDADWLIANVEFIKSEKILYSTVENLGLVERWGSKISTHELVEQLKHDTTVRKNDNSLTEPFLVAINVKSKSQIKAALLTNGIAGTYQNYRIENARNVSAKNNALWQKELLEKGGKQEVEHPGSSRQILEAEIEHAQKNLN